MFINWGKNVFNQPLPCRKIAVKFVIFFSNNNFFFFSYFIVIVFFIQRTENLTGFIFFSFVRFNVAKYVLKKIAKLK